MAIRKGFKTFPELSWAYTACVYNLLQENKNGAVLFLRRKRYFRGTASLLPQTSSGNACHQSTVEEGSPFPLQPRTIGAMDVAPAAFPGTG